MRNLTCALVLLAGALFSFSASAQISGTVTYTGTESGSIVVEAFTDEAASFEKLTTALVNPGPFEFAGVADGTYTVVAFIDSDDDGRLDAEEVWIEADTLVVVPPGATDVALDLDAYVAPGSAGDGGDDDDGCCATLDGRTRTPAALLALVVALALRRRAH